MMGHLYATTDLERSYRVNLNVIGIDGRPGVRSLGPFSVTGCSFAPIRCAAGANPPRQGAQALAHP